MVTFRTLVKYTSSKFLKIKQKKILIFNITAAAAHATRRRWMAARLRCSIRFCQRHWNSTTSKQLEVCLGIWMWMWI